MGMKNHWDAKMINRILTNPVYIGTLEQGKVSKLNYKSKKRITLSEEDWVCIQNAHEAIVSEQDFRIAGELLLRDVKQSRGTPGLLSGLLFCKDCGAQLVKRSVHYRGKVTNFYICGNYNAHHTCSRHSIKEETILGVLKTLILDYLDLNRVLSEKLRHMDFSELHFEAEFTSLEQEKKKYDTLRQSLFMDLEDSLINEDEFQHFRANYAAKIRELEAQIEAKKALVKDIRERLLSEEALLQTGTFSADETLSRSLLVHLVNRINIGEGNEIEVEFYDDEKLAILQRILAQEEKRKQEKNISLVPLYSDRKVALMPRTAKRYLPQEVKPEQVQAYRAGIYVRLSNERHESWRAKSSSPQTQEELCRAYALQEAIDVVEVYLDYEYSGTNFNRPAYQQMMQAVRERKINCILIKDLSRLGREHLEMGRLIDKVFPFLGVRFISVNDHLDTAKGVDSNKSFEVMLKNIINDMYAKDISAKILSTKHQRSKDGYFIGSVPPYEYRVEKTKLSQKLVPDENTAPVLRHIYQMALDGKAQLEIARTLNREGVTSPMVYFRTGRMKAEAGDAEWNVGGLGKILTNPAYTGKLVQGVRLQNLGKGQKQHKMAPEDYIVTEHAHEDSLSGTF